MKIKGLEMSFKTLNHAGRQEMVDLNPAGEVSKRMGSSFFRGENANFNPYGADHQKPDFASHFLLKGWTPEHPIIDDTMKVTAFGSCFAQNISKHLAEIGFDISKNRAKDIYVSSMGEGLVNVHSILEQFKWALDDWTPPSDLWHGYDATSYGLSEEVRIKTKQVFLDTDVFILTFGLSEIWYDEVTGGVFWRAVPMEHYDEARHKFRVCTFAETKNCLNQIIDLISKYIPRAKIVMTLSPIPLIATFRAVSCITANSASKALIRAALDEVIRENKAEDPNSIYYFPAFDIVNEAFPNRFVDDGRHLHPMIVPAIMGLFEATFCNTNLTLSDAEAAFNEARLQNARTVAEHALYKTAFSI